MTAELLKLTSEIVAAHVANNSVNGTDLPDFIASVYTALAKTADPIEPEAPAKLEGAVTVRKSLADPAKIISMIDGKPYSTLKRHITRHGYTPESYREAFGLPTSYPMVADAYRAMRSELSKSLGLGRKKVVAAVEEAGDAVVETVKGAGKRLGIVAAKAAAAAHLAGGSSEPAPKKRGRPAKAVSKPAPVEAEAPVEAVEPTVAEDEPKRTGWWAKSAEQSRRMHNR
jgi:predicted transcriptional regulator